jgi:GT2 family glycosyltransferase
VNPAPSKKLVLLGMMTRIPVAGVIWQTIHYLIGFQRLGYDVFYVETHARTPAMLMKREEDDSSAKAAAFIDGVMRRFDLGDRWAFNALHADGRCYGMSRAELQKLYGSAEILINLHGGTEPLPELAETGRLVYLETDPVQLQVELYQNLQQTIDFLEPHCAFFTFADNYGNPDCKLPAQDRFEFHSTRQPVVMEFWQGRDAGPGEAFTTIGNWRQPWREITLDGEVYSWSKHHEFLKFLDVPERTGQAFELALSSYEEEDQRLLEGHGWRVRHALDFSTDTDRYRSYIAGSRGEFTVAKDQNVRLRSGWFSDRSATYLAAGRPVISQETGFSNVLPSGEGLFGFASTDEAVAAIDAVSSDYERHRRAATAIARDCFNYDVVLKRLLDQVGVELARGRTPHVVEKRQEPFPLDMDLLPVSRRPTVLPDATVETAIARPIPDFHEIRAAAPGGAGPGSLASIVVITHDNIVFTRLCLESLLANTDGPSYEVIVVDNGSSDGTPAYLRWLAHYHDHVTVELNPTNLGFARACNQGLALARGDILVLLNNDTMVAPGWLSSLSGRLIGSPRDSEVGLVGPVTNRIGNEAEVETTYRTWGEFLAVAAERASAHSGEDFEIETLTMFCLAMRRDIYERVGPLDEQFEVGMVEDDDYSMRVRQAGYRIVCADNVLVHHFGESSFGKLVPTGEYKRIVAANQARFLAKWGVEWQPYGRRSKPGYDSLVDRIRQTVENSLPPGATVLVVSRGDDELLELAGRRAWHFPAAEEGGYAGHHPADSGEAIAQLEALRARGGQFLLFPETYLWWLDHYEGLQQHLESRYATVVRQPDTCVIFALNGQR